MDIKQYIEETARTESPRYNIQGIKIETTHAIIGISTEAGEMLDVVKKTLFYGKPIDIMNLREECGDLLWYIACIIRSEGWNLEEILQENIDKLKKRYPEQWTESHATARLDKGEGGIG